HFLFFLFTFPFLSWSYFMDDGTFGFLAYFPILLVGLRRILDYRVGDITWSGITTSLFLCFFLFNHTKVGLIIFFVTSHTAQPPSCWFTCSSRLISFL